MVRFFVVLLLTFLALTSLRINPVSADEVGNRVFVTEPQRPPLMVSRGGTKIWSCDGLVNKRLIDLVFSDLQILSNSEGVPPPLQFPCHYTIGSLNVFGNNVTIYSMEFYTSARSMESCRNQDFCDNFRSMSFVVSTGELHRQYMVTNAARGLTRMACVSMKGEVVHLKSGCS